MTNARGNAVSRTCIATTSSIIVGLLFICCASTSLAKEESKQPKNVDPFEVVNRPIFVFNSATDNYLLRPAGKVYNFVIPRTARIGVGNFFDNLTYPVTIVNGLLQGKFKQTGSDTLRFLLNSTFGVLGFMDIATGQGLVRHDEDFGQTFGKWGIPSGPYIVIPIIGPSTVRDGIGILGNLQVNPLAQLNNTSIRDKLGILWFVEGRAALIGPDEAIRQSFDPYLFVRDAYIQNRNFLINDSATPTDEFFDEGFDDGFDDDF